MATMSIKKGDTVAVIAGREKGKQGTVEKVIAADNRVVVTGINIRKRHLKPTRTQPRGGILEMPAPFSRSNVMIVCPHCSKPTRIRHTATENGFFRSCVHCAGSLDQAS